MDVLVVDAAPAIRQMFVAGLTGFGFRVSDVESYQQAIDVMSSGDIPYVAIVDFSRNDETAKSFLQSLENTPEYQHVKVIVTTVNSLTEDEQAQLGVDAVMEKPVDFSKLVKAVYLFHRPDSK